MSQDKFTPGPWHTGGTTYRPSGPKVNVWCQAAPGMQSGQMVAENCTPEDGRLIAAAPDLLAACENVVGACDNQEAIDPFFWPIVKQCREALDKARGPQP